MLKKHYFLLQSVNQDMGVPFAPNPFGADYSPTFIPGQGIVDPQEERRKKRQQYEYDKQNAYQNNLDAFSSLRSGNNMASYTESPIMSEGGYETGYSNVTTTPPVQKVDIPKPEEYGLEPNPQSSTVVERNPPRKPSLGDRFSSGVLGRNFDGITAGIDAVGNIGSMFSRSQSTYNGPKGDVRAGIESGYNAVADAAANFGPYGQMASMAMKAAGALNSLQGAIFGATDGMTTKDAILDSPLGFLTGVGWINQAFGKKSDTITKNEEAFANLGSSYSGTSAALDDALNFSGKKYGAFSSGARKDANFLIADRAQKQRQIEGISDQATTRFDLQSQMSAINGNARAFAMQGGYDQGSIHKGRHGLSIRDVVLSKRVVSAYKFAKGGKTEDPFTVFVNSLPEYQRPTSNGGFNVRRYWELNGKPKDFKEAVKRGMYSKEEDGWHAHSVQYNPDTDEYEFMKDSSHPTLKYELDWYNSNDPEAVKFRKEWELNTSGKYYKYVRRKPQINTRKEGGIIYEISLNSLPEFKEGGIIQSYIEEVHLEDFLPEFKEGGKVNVIPEGALHAHLHHMENADNLTKKGIPVVSEKEGGELEQQAEIEREEIIFRLEVTQKLEELMKQYNDDKHSQKEKDEFAIEAGKLLVHEILNNTIDNTNKLI